MRDSGTRRMLFLRPNGFGKTAFTRILSTCIEGAEGFGAASSLTPALRVLRLDFSRIAQDETGAVSVKDRFTQALRESIRNFLAKYPVPGGEALLAREHPLPSLLIGDFIALERSARTASLRTIIVLIDAYDQFLKRLLVENPPVCRILMMRGGWLESFHTALYADATAEYGVIRSIFITGVEPLALGDIPVTNLSADPAFARMLGLSEREARDLIGETLRLRNDSEGRVLSDHVYRLLRESCGGYRFTNAGGEALLCPGLFLSALDRLLVDGATTLPKDALPAEEAFPMAPARIRGLLELAGERTAGAIAEGIASGRGFTIDVLSDSIRLDADCRITRLDLLSAFFYGGGLTLAPGSGQSTGVHLVVPNRTAEKLIGGIAAEVAGA